MIALFKNLQMDNRQGLHEPSQTLFIVERNSAARRILQLLMSAQGWVVQTFGSAGECLRAATQQKPGCILSDLYLPDMDAAEFRRALLRSGILSPMVILSAYPDSPLTAAVRVMGVYEVLDKPCDARMVQAAIRRVCSAVPAQGGRGGIPSRRAVSREPARILAPSA